MKKASVFMLPVLLAVAMTAALRAEEVLEVDLGEPEPTATAVPAQAPTVLPSAAPSEAPTAQAPAAVATPAPEAPAATPTPDLSQVRFDGGAKPAGEEEEGLMIIAPGAASPEDSLESFGIDSPFNWKSGQRKQIKPGQEPADEGLELSAPESSELTERVRVETGEGEALPGDGDYDYVERSGLILTPQEYRVDGRVNRTKDGQFFAKKGAQVALKMEPGRQIYPGSVYTVFREGGIVQTPDAEKNDVGMLVKNVGVIKVVRIEGEEVLARVERQYETIREGDLVRLRDPERLRFYNSLRQPANAPLDLKGTVVAVPFPYVVARPGQVLYLNVGQRQGARPGLRLLVLRDDVGPDRDGVRPVRQTGRLGQVEILNAGKEASVAKVIQAGTELRVGDKVRLR